MRVAGLRVIGQRSLFQCDPRPCRAECRPAPEDDAECGGL